MKFIIAFCCSSTKQLTRFWGAEAILNTIYQRSESLLGKEREPLNYDPIRMQQPTQVADHKELIEDIRLSIQKLEGKKYSKQVEQQLMRIFEPQQGLDKIIFQNLSQKARSNLGVNKNNKFAICLNSGLMCIAMRLFYDRNEKGKLDETIGYGESVNYVVGTPGMGKSSKLISVKYLHDLRIPYLIKNSLRQDSIFKIHYKFFYFRSNDTLQNIKNITTSELINDFGEQPKQVSMFKKLTVQNCDEYFQKIQSLYQDHEIYIKVVVDQVNILYQMLYKKEDQKEYKDIIFVLKRLSRRSSTPITFVSSKNNNYEQKQIDPVLRIAGSTPNNVLHYKISIDNFISPQERLISSVECLLFELEKHGVERSKAVEVIKSVKMSLKTHLDIAIAVRNIIDQLNKESAKKIKTNAQQIEIGVEQIKTDVQQIKTGVEQIKTEQWIGKLNESFKFSSKDSQNFKNNIKNAHQKILAIKINQQTDYSQKQKLEPNLLFWVGVMLNPLFFTFNVGKTNKVIAKLNLKIDGQPMEIQKEANVVDTYINRNQGYFLSQLNFFFSYKKEVYFCYSLEELQSLKSELVKYVDIPMLTQLCYLNKKMVEWFVGSKIGYVFEIMVCNLYEEAIEGTNSGVKEVTTKIANIGFEHKLKEFSGKISEFSLSQADLNSLINCLTVPCNYFRSIKFQQSFDFVLSQFREQKLKLVLINTTKTFFDELIVEKTLKFKANFLSDSLFNSFVDKVIQSQNCKCKQLELVYYVLIPSETNNEKLYDPDLVEDVERSVAQKYRSLDFKNNKKKQPVIKLYEQSIGAVEKFKESKKIVVKVSVVVGVLNKNYMVKTVWADSAESSKKTAKIDKLMKLVSNISKGKGW